jgi:hypothetical protein
MTRRKLHLATLLVPAVLLFGGHAMAASPGTPDNFTPRAHAQSPAQVLADKKVFILHGCPYNLDKECYRNRYGKLVRCRCVS